MAHLLGQRSRNISSSEYLIKNFFFLAASYFFVLCICLPLIFAVDTNVTVVKYSENSTVNCSSNITFIINVTNNNNYNLTNILVNDTGIGSSIFYDNNHSVPVETYFSGGQYVAWRINVSANSTSQIIVNFSTGSAGNYTNYVNITNSSGDIIASAEANYTITGNCSGGMMGGGLNINLVSPLNGSALNASTFIFYYNVTGSGPANCSLWSNFTGSWAENMTNVIAFMGANNFTINSLSDGNYEWTVKCTNGTNDTLASNQTFSVDTTVPIVHVVYPANGTNLTSTNESFDWNMSDNIQLKNITFFIWNSTGTLVYSDDHSITGFYNESVTSLDLYFEYTVSYSDIYVWNVYGCDNANHCVWSQEGNYTLNQTQPAQAVNVTVVKYSENSTVNCSSNITFIINVTNNNNYNQTDLLVNDTGPLGMGISYLDTPGSSSPYRTYFSGGQYIAWRINVSANSTSQIIVNFTVGPSGNYTNSIIVLNSSGSTIANASANYTIAGDCGDMMGGGLTVNLTSPTEGFLFTSAPFVFNFSVTGPTPINCSLWSNFTGSWAENQTKINITDLMGLNFTIENLTNSSYKWNVMCTNGTGESWAQSNKTFFVGSNSGANNSPYVLLDSLTYRGGPIDDYNNISGEMMMFLGETVDIKGTVSDADLANWTIRLENSSGIVNASLCFDESVLDGTLCTWNTSNYCSGECVNYTLILNATDSSGHSNLTRMENLTIDNIPPVINMSTEVIRGDASEWFGRANITDGYLRRSDALIFGANDSLIIGWNNICNNSQCDWVGSGSFNMSWHVEVYSLNGTVVPLYYDMFFPDLVDSDVALVPGCLSINGSESNYTCEEVCDNPICNTYRWWLVYNLTDRDQINYSFIGLTNENDCDMNGCYINTSLIQNGTTKFKPQIDYLDRETGVWTAENTSLEMNLYEPGDLNNSRLESNISESGNYTFAFRAWDYWWTSVSSVTDDITLGQILPDVRIDNDLHWLNMNSTNYGFVLGLFNITGYANSTNFSNWTISLLNSTGMVNQSLCFGNTPINGTFCTWNTTKYCSGECENYTLVLNVTDGFGNNIRCVAK